jgi:predicted nucleotidyltransferase
VDVLVEVIADARFSLVDLVAVKDFLEDRLGRPVDVVTKEGLAPDPGPCAGRSRGRF